MAATAPRRRLISLTPKPMEGQRLQFCGREPGGLGHPVHAEHPLKPQRHGGGLRRSGRRTPIEGINAQCAFAQPREMGR